MNRSEWTSRALLPFTKGEPLPYIVYTDGEADVLVTELRRRDGVVIGGPTSLTSYHLIGDLAAAWVGGRMVTGARWLCGATSIGARIYRTDVLEEHYAPFIDDGLTVDSQVCAKCRAIRDGETGPCVYRVWDKKRTRLLYIGSTKNWPNRRAQHRSDTWWWPLAKEIDLEYFPTIAEAREAEALAIRTERPQMNVAHNRRRDLA